MPRRGVRATALSVLLAALSMWGLATGCPVSPEGQPFPEEAPDGGAGPADIGRQDGPPPGATADGPQEGTPDGGPDVEPQGPPPTRVAAGLDARPANPTCVAPPRPQAATGATTAPAYPRLTFVEPLLALQAPGDDSRVYVLERGGRILVFANDPAVAKAQLFADLRGKVDATHTETGLLGMAFHPRFATTGDVFLSYVTRRGGDLSSIISRVKSRDGGATLDLASEQVVLQLPQPASNHNGGHIAFGPDGYLYIGFGDGGPGRDPQRRAQNLGLLYGKLLRIDVDGAEPYALPPDNPFVGNKKARPEIWAYGFRNPWRWSFDRQTGDLWLGDVGEQTLEEVDRVVKGGNYGWSIMEGTRCFQGAGCNGPNLKLPVVTYGHDMGVAITGGYVYRGTEVPALFGQYVYGDFGSGNLWALDPTASVGGNNPKLLASTPFAISSFGELNDGELLVVDFGGGKLHRLVPVGQAAPSQLATQLSQTGCVDPADPRRPAPGVLAYAVNAPLWSDGARKGRFLAVPDGEEVEVGNHGHLDFPPGSVLMKTFALGERMVETRLFMRHPDGSWAGYSYEWNDAQTDAVLLEQGKSVEVAGQTWTFPSRGECMFCHTAAAGYSLGPEVAQLNGDALYPGNRVANQLETLAAIGVLDGLDAPADQQPRLESPAGQGPLEARARAYLHANCASCHRPGGVGRGTADLRFDTPLQQAGLCNAPPEVGDLGVAGAMLLVPGAPERSLLSLRMHRRGADQMPPLASHQVDPDGVAVVDAWIRSLQQCP